MNDQDEIWNPARRLYEMLKNARTRGKMRDTHNSEPTIRMVFAAMFEVPPTSTIEIYKGFALLSEALDWTENQIAAASLKQKGNYTRNLPSFRLALEIGNINESWERFNQQISEEAMADLLHAATRLAEADAEVSLSKEELVALSKELDELIELFHDADIDTELRKSILDLLLASREILGEYRIRGGEALKKIIELATGRLLTKRSQFDEENKEILKKLVEWLKKLDGLYGRLGKYGKLLPYASQLFLDDA